MISEDSTTMMMLSGKMVRAHCFVRIIRLARELQLAESDRVRAGVTLWKGQAGRILATRTATSNTHLGD